jgi:hypothetical protein
LFLLPDTLYGFSGAVIVASQLLGDLADNQLLGSRDLRSQSQEPSGDRGDLRAVRDQSTPSVFSFLSRERLQDGAERA